MRSRTLTRLAAVGLSAALLAAPAAQALTTEQAAQLLQTLYIDAVSPSVLEQPTVKGMVQALGDPYTEYYTPEEYVSFVSTMQDASLVGIGVVFTNTPAPVPEEGLRIEQVLDGSPAAMGGLLAGDLIFAVDGQDIRGMTLDQITGLIRGEEGTPVEIAYCRDQVLETVTLTRSTVVVAATTTELIDGHIGYIRCTTFGEDTVGHFKDGIEKYAADADVWIVDLRSNLGGAADAATQAAGLFTGAGYAAILRDGSDNYSAYYNEEGPMTLYPVIVLVNQASASASELFSLAIQSQDAGIVVGSRTYGKGVAQIVCDKSYMPDFFPDGDAIKITSYRFFSPLGNTCDQIGVIPQLLVDPAYAGDVAALLSSEPVSGHRTLRIDMTWRWFVDLDAALTEENLPAFLMLLDAIPAGTRLWRESEDFSDWTSVTIEELCRDLELDYTPVTFSDAEESDYSVILDVLKTYDMIHGDPEGTYRPKDALTRAELCILLANALNCKTPTIPNPYSDVEDDALYAPAVLALTGMGLVGGKGNGIFDPDAPITHQEYFALMGNLAKFLNFGIYNTAARMTGENLEDSRLSSFDEWARPGTWLLSMSQTSILGDPISLLWSEVEDIDPESPTTREEAAHLLYTLLSYTDILPI